MIPTDRELTAIVNEMQGMKNPQPAQDFDFDDNSLFAQLNRLNEMSHILEDSMTSLIDKGQPFLRPLPVSGDVTASEDKFMGSTVAGQVNEVYRRISRVNQMINGFRQALDV